jgi:hypothetical protein
MGRLSVTADAFPSPPIWANEAKRFGIQVGSTISRDSFLQASDVEITHPAR